MHMHNIPHHFIRQVQKATVEETMLRSQRRLEISWVIGCEWWDFFGGVKHRLFLPFWMENLMNWMNSWKFGWLGKEGFFLMFELRGLKWFELWKGNLHISDFLPVDQWFLRRLSAFYLWILVKAGFESQTKSWPQNCEEPVKSIETCEWGSKSRRILTRLYSMIMHYNALQCIIWYSFDRQQTPPGSSTSLSIFFQNVG